MSDMIIDAFVKNYEQQCDYYERLAKHVEKLCETGLERYPRHSYITSRVKTLSSLRRKLAERQRERSRSPYQNEEEIKDDIVDIVGVRISLYFPNSASVVEKMIEDTLSVVGAPKQIEGRVKEKDDERKDYISGQEAKKPYDWKFPGYTAKHFRVRLLRPIKGYKGEMVEIQVVSALAHVWSELEHEIVYKVMDNPTEDQKRMLDSLNGLVRTGEVILEQLQQISAKSNTLKDSDQFDNKYNLGAYLADCIPQGSVKRRSITVLFKFLRIANLNSARELSQKIGALGFEQKTNQTREKTKARFLDFDLSASIYIIDYILGGLTERDYSEIEARAIGGKEGDEYVPSDPPSWLYKCKVIISTLIWLWELFPENQMEITCGLKEHFYASENGRKSLKWALGSITPTNIIDNRPVGEVDQAHLSCLWHVFESSSEKVEVFKFAFKISKIGVWRELPEDISQLEMLRMSLKIMEEEEVGDGFRPMEC